MTNRFSTEDLFRAILFPNRDISPLYRFTEYRMRDDGIHVGQSAYFSAEGVMLKTGLGIVRLVRRDIVSAQPSQRSIMTEGLLESVQAGDLADLYQFLKEI